MRQDRMAGFKGATGRSEGGQIEGSSQLTAVILRKEEDRRSVFVMIS